MKPTNKKSVARKVGGAKHPTLQFETEAGRAEDQRRRDLLIAYKHRLGFTLPELAADLTRLHGDRVSYGALRSWTSNQDSQRARLMPKWPLRILELGHPELLDAADTA